jgi:hypothetical protein
VLKELTSSEFIGRVSAMREGREKHVLGSDPAVMRLICCLREFEGNASKELEACADKLFEDLRRDEEFEHSEIVMAMLFALKQSGASLFGEMAATFSESQAAELGRLSRFARRLLQK